MQPRTGVCVQWDCASGRDAAAHAQPLSSAFGTLTQPALSTPDPPRHVARCRALASQLELLFVNMQHLAARLRQHEALAALVREYEDVIAQAAALTRTEGGREGAAAQAPT